MAYARTRSRPRPKAIAVGSRRPLKKCRRISNAHAARLHPIHWVAPSRPGDAGKETTRPSQSVTSYALSESGVRPVGGGVHLRQLPVLLTAFAR